jgi:hypothetical protein
LQCFSNCLPLSHQGVPFLNSHNIPSYAFQTHLFEQVEPLKVQNITLYVTREVDIDNFLLDRKNFFEARRPQQIQPFDSERQRTCDI